MEVFITGPAASGKTVLARKLERLLRDEGYIVKRTGEQRFPHIPQDCEVLTVDWGTSAELKAGV